MAKLVRRFGGWFGIAMILVIFAGYGMGKEAAFRDNARDNLQRHSTNPEG